MKNPFISVIIFSVFLFLSITSCKPEPESTGFDESTFLSVDTTAVGHLLKQSYSALEIGNFAKADSLLNLIETEDFLEDEKKYIRAKTGYFSSLSNLQQGKFQLSIENGNEARASLLKIAKPGEFLDMDILEILMTAHGVSFNLDSAKNYADTLYKLSVDEFGRFSPEAAQHLNNKGKYLLEERDYGRAMNYMKRSLHIISQNSKSGNVDKSNAYRRMGMVYLESGSNQTAKIYLDSAMYYARKVTPVDSCLIARAFYVTGQNELLSANFSNSIDAHENAIPYWESCWKNKNHPAILSSKSYIGVGHRFNQDYQKGYEYSSDIIGLLKRIYPCSHPDVVSTEIELATSLFGLDKLDAAQSSLDSAYYCLGFDLKKPTASLKLDDHIELIQYLLPQVELWNLRYKKTGTQKWMLKSQALITKIDTIYSRALAETDWDKSKQVVENWSFNFGDIKMKSNFLYAEKTGNPDYYLKAFEALEKAKAFIMRSAMRLSKSEFSDVANKELIQKLREVKKELAIESIKQPPANKNIELLNSRYYSLKDSFYQDLKALEKRDPKYFELKYKQEVVSVEKIQKEILQPNQAMVSYFLGDSSINIFVISKNDFKALRIRDADRIDQIVQNFRCGIMDDAGVYTCKSVISEETEKGYIANSFKLYQKLIVPIEPQLKGIKSLIFVPDGTLGYLPFEALIGTIPGKNVAAKDYDFLINKYDISYAYSATLQDEMLNLQHEDAASKVFLGVAPIFENGNPQEYCINVGKLNHNIEEVKNMKNLLGGDVLVGSEATESAFIDICPDYKILHLSTHGSANDIEGEESLLAFYRLNDQLENECLFLHELYNTVELNCELLVLSACQTGIGELRRGEGIISLARGFSYVGAKSIVSSLWTVDEGSTAQLMTYFYKNLKNGLSKDAALSQAKRMYIQNSKETDSPFNWAPFILVGDSKPIF